MDIRQRLGSHLRRLRDAKGLSQEAFAHDAGIHCTYISDIERRARNPTITVVETIAVTLGATTSDLLCQSSTAACRLGTLYQVANSSWREMRASRLSFEENSCRTWSRPARYGQS